MENKNYKHQKSNPTNTHTYTRIYICIRIYKCIHKNNNNNNNNDKNQKKKKQSAIHSLINDEMSII